MEIRKNFGIGHSSVRTAIWQGILHLTIVYFIARFCTPWLLDRTYYTILPILLRRPSPVSFQFFFSHLFAFSFVPGIIGGFLIARFLKNGIIRFVWAVCSSRSDRFVLRRLPLGITDFVGVPY